MRLRNSRPIRVVDRLTLLLALGVLAREDSGPLAVALAGCFGLVVGIVCFRRAEEIASMVDRNARLRAMSEASNRTLIRFGGATMAVFGLLMAISGIARAIAAA